MYRHTDLDYVKLHIQELYAEADRERLIKNSNQYTNANHTRWFIRILDRFTAMIARWRCVLQGRFPQSLFPILNSLALAPNPCTCAPEPCSE
jgi:hypothetical protein